jgi:hypothetical protein
MESQTPQLSSGPVPFQLFYEEMRKFRDTMEQGFEALGSKLEIHAKEDWAVALRVALIEAELKAGKELKAEALDKANRRSTLISAVVSITIMVAFKALDWFRQVPIH